MKSTFLLLVILGTLTTSQVFGQTKKMSTPVKTKTVTTTPVVEAAAPEAPKSPFDKFYERLGISYGGFYTSPILDEWDTTNAAISPEFVATKKDSYSQNIFNQFNFSYNFGGMFKFHIVPRFTLFFTHPRDQDPGDRAMVTIEDTLVAFSGTIWTNEAKTFSWWMRPGVRLPTSHANRTFNDAAFGTITHVLDWNNTFTFNPNKDFELGYTIVNRVWVYEDRYNLSKHRILSTLWTSYALTDKSKVQLYYDHWLQNGDRWKSINDKNPVYKDKWQSLSLGLAYDVTEKLNVTPLISAFINDVPFSVESTFLQLWISYSIK